MAHPLRSWLAILAATCLAAAGTAAWGQAAQPAGRFVSVAGDVSILGSDGARRSAQRGGEIREGDTIITGASALAQARMSDGGLISVRSDSEFKLEQFAYRGKEDRNASFVVNILKGGFRTITGLIAQVNRGGYRITTPAATIGVRGTHFELVHVLPQIATPDVPAGTYNRVFEGITTIQNPGGQLLQVTREQTAFAALQAAAQPVLVAPPARLFGTPTPVPRAALPQNEERAHKGEFKGEFKGERAFKAEIKGESRAHKGLARSPALERAAPEARDALRTTPLGAGTTVRAPALNPLDTPATSLQIAPTTTVSPTLSTTTPISPTLSTTVSPTTTSTTTIAPTLSNTTTISPTLSTTISPTTTTTTTTIAPTTTTISPTTTTISPTLITR